MIGSLSVLWNVSALGRVRDLLTDTLPSTSLSTRRTWQVGQILTKPATNLLGTLTIYLVLDYAYYNMSQIYLP